MGESAYEIKWIKEFIIDPTHSLKNNSKILICLNIDFNSLFQFFSSFIFVLLIGHIIKLLINGDETHLTFKTIYRPHYSYRSILSLIVNILNNQTRLFGHVIISTNIFVNLVHRADSLRYISTTFFEYLWIF